MFFIVKKDSRVDIRRSPEKMTTEIIAEIVGSPVAYREVGKVYVASRLDPLDTDKSPDTLQSFRKKYDGTFIIARRLEHIIPGSPRLIGFDTVEEADRLIFNRES